MDKLTDSKPAEHSKDIYKIKMCKMCMHKGFITGWNHEARYLLWLVVAVLNLHHFTNTHTHTQTVSLSLCIRKRERETIAVAS